MARISTGGKTDSGSGSNKKAPMSQPDYSSLPGAPAQEENIVQRQELPGKVEREELMREPTPSSPPLVAETQSSADRAILKSSTTQEVELNNDAFFDKEINKELNMESKIEEYSPAAYADWSRSDRMAQAELTYGSTPPAPIKKGSTPQTGQKPPSLSNIADGGRKPGNRLFFAGVLGIILVVASLVRLRGDTSGNLDPNLLPTDKTARSMLLTEDSQRLAASVWRNDNPGLIGKIFRKLCIGYAKSDGCNEKALHPLVQVADQLGIELTFPKEEDKRVIDQTIQYNSRAFTFGK